MRNKYPSEIFGYPHFDKGRAARRARTRHWCPFADESCNKKSRLTDIPFGVCAAHYDQAEIVLCPRRFLSGMTLFSDIAMHHFGTTNNIIVFPEVGLKTVGNFDFVMVKHKPLSMEIEDFVLIEFQTGQTTSTGELVRGFKDFGAGVDVSSENYQFGLNYYDIWKRTFTQILNKGLVVEAWGKKIYWVVQEPIYAYFARRYHLSDLKHGADFSTVFFLCDIKRSAKGFELTSTRNLSASIDQLLSTFRNNPDLPTLTTFERTLEKRLRLGPRLGLSLAELSGQNTSDVNQPSSTNTARESSPPYEPAHVQSELQFPEGTGEV